MKFFSEGSWRFTRSLCYTRVRFSTAAAARRPHAAYPPRLPTPLTQHVLCAGGRAAAWAA